MSLPQQIISIFAPHACLSCGAEHNRLLCVSCTTALPTVPSRCYRCHASTRGYAVCRTCARDTPLKQVIIGTPYRDVAKELLHRAKYERARSGLDEIGEFLAPLARLYLPENALLVPVPTASSRVRQRGYDQADCITRRISLLTSLPWSKLLVRRGQVHQVGSNRAQRIAHVKQAFRPVNTGRIKGAHIVLVDDVVTTGATLEEAARTLRRAGAAQVDAILFAQPLS